MGFIGHLYGMEIHTSEHVVERATAFSRKQTRKFKNHRWVKKYMKKYSYEITRPSMIQYGDKLLIHPEALKYIKKKAEEANTRTFTFGQNKF